MGTSSTSNEVWELLSAAGVTLSRELTEEGAIRLSVSKYDPLSDPRGAMTIASSLASAAVELAPTVIVAWEGLEDAILAFAVGAALGVPVIRAFDMEGLIRHSGRFPEEPRGVLVTDALREDEAIEALKTLFVQRGGVLSGVLSLVGVKETTADVQVRSLVSASDGPVEESEGA